MSGAAARAVAPLMRWLSAAARGTTRDGVVLACGRLVESDVGAFYLRSFRAEKLASTSFDSGVTLLRYEPA